MAKIYTTHIYNQWEGQNEENHEINRAGCCSWANDAGDGKK